MPDHTTPEPFDNVLPHHLRWIALRASVDIKTVKRVIEGAPTRPMCRERVERELRAAGLERLIP